MSKIQNVHIPAEQKNYAINGALDFWQEKAGNTTTINTASSSVVYAADMVVVASFGATNKNYSFVRSTDVPTFQQSGFQTSYSLLFTQITGIPSLAANDQTNPFMHFMEGTDYEKIHGKTVTFGFWIKGSVVGTYPLSLRNNNGDRSYVATFPINLPNTWEYKTITLTLDTSGTWAFDTNRGLTIVIGSCAGSSLSTATPNTWQTGNLLTTTSSTNWMATSGATLRVALFSIVEGSLGFGATGFQRAGKTIQQELAMCQRFYEKSYLVDTPVDTNDGGTGCEQYITQGSQSEQRSWGFRVTKRASPGMALKDPVGGTAGQVDRARNITSNSQVFLVAEQVGTRGFGTQTASAAAQIIRFHWVADARL